VLASGVLDEPRVSASGVSSARTRRTKQGPVAKQAPVSRQATGESPKPATPKPIHGSKLQWFGVMPTTPTGATATTAAGATEPAKKPRARQVKKNNPQHVAAARELRDRWLEQVNAGAARPALATAKYAIARDLPAPTPAQPTRLLAA
jgi:hypothetical protein